MIMHNGREARMFCDTPGCPVSIQSLGLDRLAAIDHLHEAAFAYGWIVGDNDQYHFCDAHDEETTAAMIMDKR